MTQVYEHLQTLDEKRTQNLIFLVIFVITLNVFSMHVWSQFSTSSHRCNT